MIKKLIGLLLRYFLLSFGGFVAFPCIAASIAFAQAHGEGYGSWGSPIYAIWSDSSLYADSAGVAGSAGATSRADSLINNGSYIYGDNFLRSDTMDTAVCVNDTIILFNRGAYWEYEAGFYVKNDTLMAIAGFSDIDCGIYGYSSQNIGGCFVSPAYPFIASLRNNSPLTDTIAIFGTADFTGFGYIPYIKSVVDSFGSYVIDSGIAIYKDSIRFLEDTFSLYASNDTFFIDAKHDAGYLDLSELTVLFKPGWMEFDQIKPATNDSSSSSIGWSDNPYGTGYFIDLYVDSIHGFSPIKVKDNMILEDSLFIVSSESTCISSDKFFQQGTNYNATIENGTFLTLNGSAPRGVLSQSGGNGQLLLTNTSNVTTITLNANSGITITDGNFSLKDTLFVIDASGADSSMIYDNGTVTYFETDNSVVFTNQVQLTNNLLATSDTIARITTANFRAKELWGLRHYWSSPDKADSSYLYDDGDTTWLISENPVKIPNLVGGGGGGAMSGSDIRDSINTYDDNSVDGTAIYSTVFFGQYDTIVANCLNSGIVAGYHNTIKNGTGSYGDYIGMIGGRDNQANAIYSFTGGGSQNYILASATSGAIVGGYADTIQGTYGFIGGGQNNKIVNNYSMISGGQNNYVGHQYSAIIGGYADTIKYSYNGIIAGGFNECGGSSLYSGIFAGRNNYVNGLYDAIIGGYGNEIGDYTNSDYNVIIGGYGNDIDTSAYSVILGGVGNNIRGSSADGSNVAMGDSTVIDSCYGSFAMNCDLKKADSVMAVTKEIWTIEGTDTTIINKNGIYSSSSPYWYCKYMDAFSLSSGGSGATLVTPDNNTLGGYNLDADGEYLYFNAAVCNNWNEASDPIVIVIWETDVDNTGGGVNDSVEIDLQCWFKGEGETSNKTQALSERTEIGQSARYKQFLTTFTIDHDDGSNPVEEGDVFTFRLNFDATNSDITDIIINFVRFGYRCNVPNPKAY